MKKFVLFALVTAATASQAVTAPASCVSMKEAGATVSTVLDTGCITCSVQNAAAAADGTATTAAVLNVAVAVPTRGAALRATARPGVTFPSGQTAGALVSVPAGVGQSYSVGIRTYLGGVLQEISNGLVVNGLPVQTSFGGTTVATTGQGSTFQSLKTKKAYDAVEVFVSNVQAQNPTGTSVPLVNLGTAGFNVAEICSRQ